MSQCTWAPDFCIFCDKQVNTDDAYCSQACRLADYEKGQAFNTNSFSGSSSTGVSSKSTTSTSGYTSHQFRLPPAFNFEPYRQRSTNRKPESPPASPKSAANKSSSSGYQSHIPPMRPTLPYRATYDIQASRILNNSSSRSSLASTNSANSTNYQGWEGLSESVTTQLRDYAFAFERARESKRRTTMG